MDGDFRTRLRTRVAELQSATRSPSLLAAVGVSGVLRTVAVAGYADVESRQGASEETGYRIGSITKTFTAALTLVLAGRGELDVNAPVRQYLPGTSFGHIPLRMLLSHNSGVQREAPTDMWSSMIGPSAAELRKAFGAVEFVAEPGRRWHYSNLGYAILGQIIEEVTGQACETMIDRTLLDPLGLDRTGWTRPADAAVGYRSDPYADVVHREPVMDQRAVGVGGQMWSTPGDLVRWAHALAGGEPTVLPADVVDQMHTMQVMVDWAGWTRGWGLGLILERRDGRILAGHTGAVPGFQSALALDRETGLSAVVLVNATRGIKPAELAAETLCGAIAEQPSVAKPTWRPAECPPDIRPLLGSWWSEADELVFRWLHDGLHACLTSDPENTDTRFVVEGPRRFRAAEGRLFGELLTVEDSPVGIEMRWATYPVTRTPR